MKLSTLFLPFIAAQKTTPEPVDERAVIFNRLPKVFNWYEIVITKFVRGKKAGKYIHRVNELKQRIVWETDRCEAAGPVSKNASLVKKFCVPELFFKLEV